MGNLTLKPASGGDLILQNDDAGAKIQINNDDTIDITGSIDTGTFNGTIGSSATGGSGLTAHGRIGQSCQVRKQTTTTGISGSGYIGTMDSDGWEPHSNSDSSMFTTSNGGITVSLAGTYLVNYGAYFWNQSSTAGYMVTSLAIMPNGGSRSTVGPTYHILNNATGGDSSQYTLHYHGTAISLNANDLVDMEVNRSDGTYAINHHETFIRLTYLSDHTFSNSY